MNMELMNTFTDEQLNMCETENLISYIQELKEEVSNIETIWKAQRPHHTGEYDIYNSLDIFFMKACVEEDNIEQKNGTFKAPTSFDDLYYEYKYYTICHGLKPIDKKLAKCEFLKKQELSRYGLNLGKTLSERAINGSINKPYLNFKVIEEEED